MFEKKRFFEKFDDDEMSILMRKFPEKCSPSAELSLYVKKKLYLVVASVIAVRMGGLMIKNDELMMEIITKL